MSTTAGIARVQWVMRLVRSTDSYRSADIRTAGALLARRADVGGPSYAQ